MTATRSESAGKESGLRLRHRSFEDFSYGKQSLDGLLFPQRAFFFLFLQRGIDEAGLFSSFPFVIQGLNVWFSAGISLFLRPFTERLLAGSVNNRRDSSVG